MKVSICIATYHRPEMLAALLEDLVAQTCQPWEVVVVDNDPQGSARAVVNAVTADFALHYAVQPEQNISLTRNLGIQMASGDWLAIIDDDERAPVGWLAAMLQTQRETAADAVLGHVECLLPKSSPAWLRRGDFYASPSHPEGMEFPLNQISKGNALLRASLFRQLDGPYDPAYGITGGGDLEMYGRFQAAGGKLVWCAREQLTELVEPQRLSARWLLWRALSGGQVFMALWRRGDFGDVSRLGQLIGYLRCFAQAWVALLLALLSWPLGWHRAMKWWIKVAANIGKLSTLGSWRYRQYAESAASSGADHSRSGQPC